MATFHKFNNTVQYMGLGAVNLASDTIKVMLTNTAPVATNSVYSDISSNELAAGNGYATGGATITGITWTNSGGVSTLTGNAYTWTSGPSNMGPFQYAVAYDSSASTKVLLGWWDYGSVLTLIGANADQFAWAPVSSIIFTGSFA